MSQGDVKFVITVDSTGATQRIQTFDQAVEQLGKTAQSTSAQTKSFWSDLKTGLIPSFTAAQLAADGIQKGFRAIKNELIDTIKESIEAEKVDRSLEAAVSIVGEAAGGTADKIKNYADAMMRKTIYDDEAIKSAQTLIIQMRGTTAGLGEATKGAIGLAAVFQMDLQSAARAVAQGLEGNYRQLGMLIPAVREARTENEKHAALMEELAKYYQRAGADAEVFGGKLASLRNVYGDLKKTIGDFVTKNQDVIDTLSGAKEIITWLDRNLQHLAATQEKAQGKITWKDFTPLVLVRAFNAVAGEAAKANKEYQESWEGFTEYYLRNARNTLLEAPVLIEKVTKALREGAVGSDSFRLAAGALRAELAQPLKAIVQLVVQGLEGPSEGKKSMIETFLGNVPKVFSGMEMESKTALEKMTEDVRRYSETGGAAISALNAVFQQGTDNRMIALDAEYAKRVAYINATITDEGARQQALAKLDDEFTAKRRKAAVALAIANKAMSISSAIISTHEAAAKAMAQGGFILGIPWSAIIEALGWIQVGLIAAQPIPMAKGGYFEKETVMAGRNASYRLAEAWPASAGEIVSPVPIMRQIVREEVRAAHGGSGRTEVNLNINAPLIQTTALSESDIRRASKSIFRALDDELRGRGLPALGRA